MENLTLYAEYNHWMNNKLYSACEKLSDDQLRTDRKAYFGSILGTLNHILVGDILWLKRFATHPLKLDSLNELIGMEQPAALNSCLYSDFNVLKSERQNMDQRIIYFVQEITEEHLNTYLSYTDTEGRAKRKLFRSLLCHFFNHQTHHRGQVSTLLSQLGIDVGETDLLALIPDRF